MRRAAARWSTATSTPRDGHRGDDPARPRPVADRLGVVLARKIDRDFGFVRLPSAFDQRHTAMPRCSGVTAAGRSARPATSTPGGPSRCRGSPSAAKARSSSSTATRASTCCAACRPTIASICAPSVRFAPGGHDMAAVLRDAERQPHPRRRGLQPTGRQRVRPGAYTSSRRRVPALPRSASRSCCDAGRSAALRGRRSRRRHRNRASCNTRPSRTAFAAVAHVAPVAIGRPTSGPLAQPIRGRSRCSTPARRSRRSSTSIT